MSYHFLNFSTESTFRQSLRFIMLSEASSRNWGFFYFKNSCTVYQFQLKFEKSSSELRKRNKKVSLSKYNFTARMKITRPFNKFRNMSLLLSNPLSACLRNHLEYPSSRNSMIRRIQIFYLCTATITTYFTRYTKFLKMQFLHVCIKNVW